MLDGSTGDISSHDDVIKWKHFSALLALCAGNSPVTGEFPSQMPVTWCFDVFFDLRLNKRLSKQPRCRWFETPLCWLWRHWNAAIDKRCEHMARLIYPDNGKCKNHIRVWTSNRIRLTGVKRICKLIEFDVSHLVWKYSCIHYHHYVSWSAGMTFRRSGCRLLTRRVNTGGRWPVSLNTTVVNITC